MLQRQNTVKSRPRTAATSPGPAEEARLISRIADGDGRAFDELYRIYRPRLTRFLINMTRRRQMTEEVLNDTMMVVWNRPHSFDGTSKVSTWVFAIAYRKALKALHRNQDPLEDKHAETRPSLEAGPEQQVGDQQVRKVLWDAISELSADHRAVVDLTYFHENGYREIAEIMNCPVDTIKTRMFHARRHLKRKLAGQLVDWL
ncbi:RNA polymerase sigma factor [Phenylobacterium montanum]|uniref:Sigma-70 family RNA polymerase sigma factor n=1 Tax=Phenylobacterium montanum TaxID=2823693 RepID=A0A975IX35_9CAUL|nr:sigma-70 family RNA polymerase sigma factor [Caulobacter sp. S6]QUD90480.1 sigma-70 family RNA polymerase sigma factor [Caulobacter sp. S6]